MAPSCLAAGVSAWWCAVWLRANGMGVPRPEVSGMERGLVLRETMVWAAWKSRSEERDDFGSSRSAPGALSPGAAVAGDDGLCGSTFGSCIWCRCRVMRARHLRVLARRSARLRTLRSAADTDAVPWVAQADWGVVDEFWCFSC